MGFHRATERKYTELVNVGIAIKQVAGEQLHLGILYRIDKSDPRFCHLAWHYQLMDEPPQNDYYWDDCLFLIDDPVNAKIFSARMLTIAQSKRIIAYGIYHEGGVFTHDAKFIGFPDEGMGLTCASFVVAVFHSMGLPILQEKTWQSRGDDNIWQQKILKLLEERAGAAHVRAAKKYVGAFRMRPEEVAASATAENPPLDFKQADAAGKNLRSLILAAAA